MALSKTTQDHEEIRRWAEERGARPAAVSSTETDDRTGIIRLEFPGTPNAKDDALEEISWDEWFDKFDASGLEFNYQQKTAAGQRSNFNKLTYPSDEKASKSHGSSRGGTREDSKSSSKSHARTVKKSATAHSRGTSSAKSTGRTAGPASGRGSSNRTTGRASSSHGSSSHRSSSGKK
jgi:hypothetical protein